MGLHVGALLTGAAVGALVTYITKDEDVRKTVERFIDGSVDAFQAFLSRITPEKKSALQQPAEDKITGDTEQAGTGPTAEAGDDNTEKEAAVH